jgi:hypothetical protein
MKAVNASGPVVLPYSNHLRFHADNTMVIEFSLLHIRYMGYRIQEILPTPNFRLASHWRALTLAPQNE